MLVPATERLFVFINQKADVITNRYSQRIGQSLRFISSTLHQSLLSSSRWMRCNSFPPEFVSACQQEVPKTVPRYPLHQDGSGVKNRVEGFLHGVYYVGENDGVSLEEMSWLHDSFHNPSPMARFLFHALNDVALLLESYDETKNVVYLRCAKDFADKWIAECLRTERWPDVWDDHGTAIRALILCKLWAYSRVHEAAGSPFMSSLLSAIIRHAEKLCHRAFYRPEHNHGVTQAYALLAIGLMFPLHANAWKWVDLGRSRLEAQVAQNVSAEGLHREHSPYYHFYVFQQFSRAYQLGKANGVQFSVNFSERLEKMLAHGAQLIKPDGTMCSMGDSSKTAKVMVEGEDLSTFSCYAVNSYLYSSSNGRRGNPPKDTSVIFPGAGYAILRSGWGVSERFQDERFLAVRLGTFETTHIHRDVLSFELYAYGQDLIVDSGGPFLYGHQLREDYFLSTRAHNTVVVDDGDQNVGAGRILKFNRSPLYDTIDAAHTNYAGVTHRRLIVFLRKRYYLIIDRLESMQRHHYSQLFHLNPNLEANLEDLVLETRNCVAGATVKLIPLFEGGLGVSLHKGKERPAQGWVTAKDGEMMPNYTVAYEQTGTNAIFVVLVLPQPDGRCLSASGHIEGSLFETRASISVSVEGCNDLLSFSSDGELSIEHASQGAPV
jgi:heparinase II/III-like protein